MILYPDTRAPDPGKTFEGGIVKRGVLYVVAVTVFALAITLSAPTLLGSSGLNGVGVPQSAVTVAQDIVSAQPEIAKATKAPTLEAKKLRGFCACSCSSVPNCNTSADCGGNACSAFISCCAKPSKNGSAVAANCFSANPPKNEQVITRKSIAD